MSVGLNKKKFNCQVIDPRHNPRKQCESDTGSEGWNKKIKKKKKT